MQHYMYHLTMGPEVTHAYNITCDSVNCYTLLCQALRRLLHADHALADLKHYL